LATISPIQGNYYPPRKRLNFYATGISLELASHAMTINHSPVNPTGLSQLPSHQQGFVGERSAQLGAGGEHHGLVANALDELACGVIIIDQRGRILHQNLAASVVLSRGDCVCVDHGVISATHAPDVRQLSEALSKAAAGKRSMIALGALSRTTVAVVPLHRQAAQGQATEPRFALMFSRAGVCEALMLSFFSRAHQLTAAEENVLGLMCAGLTAPEMAQQLKVGEATIRTHVRNICAKTHSSGIREVVKRLAVLPPLMAAVMPMQYSAAS
jgi:DNA-binding CsgD family transcriptional regulator